MKRLAGCPEIVHRLTFAAALLLCLSPAVCAPVALVLGFCFSVLLGHPFERHNQKVINWLLKASVVGLGFGINAAGALAAAKQGLGITLLSVLITLLLGAAIGKLLHLGPKVSHLIASGTAICGGSAIAALAPVLRVNEKEMSVSLGTVFLLNAVALLIFPVLGHYLQLSQFQFGLWSAIAIHDTSSVIGAASAFGAEALEVATTVKLVRALWIVPVAFVSSFAFRVGNQKVELPWFIGLFVLAMLLHGYLPVAAELGRPVAMVSEAGLTITLFLVGAGLSLEKIKSAGWRPLLLGLTLWVLVAAVSLWGILLL
ncbi:YeiH family protein [Pontibacter beigongshangensis]|uniref:YeiH family protein n=1 Tax=Pontibacter beigongshangensis TaxID=2574733 RepID=UPI001650091E|nr:putative sulfate exporter family transporter [Pontibacter beigongshangensis]